MKIVTKIFPPILLLVSVAILTHCTILSISPTETENNPPILVGGFRVLGEDEYANDRDFGVVDGRLRKEEGLDGWVLDKVEERLVLGQIFRLTYRDGKGSGGVRIYQVFVPPKRIQIQSETETQPPSPLPTDISSLQAQFLKDKEINRLDIKIRREADRKLGNHKIVYVRRETVMEGERVVMGYWSGEGKVVEVGVFVGPISVEIVKRPGDDGKPVMNQTSAPKVTYFLDKNKPILTTQQLLQTPQLQKSYKTLLASYPQFLSEQGSKIASISYTENDEFLTYRITIQQETGGRLLGVVRYEILWERVEILALVVLGS